MMHLFMAHELTTCVGEAVNKVEKPLPKSTNSSGCLEIKIVAITSSLLGKPLSS
jgi:hypothetical protein